jgi:hypothetical protein
MPKMESTRSSRPPHSPPAKADPVHHALQILFVANLGDVDVGPPSKGSEFGHFRVADRLRQTCRVTGLSWDLPIELTRRFLEPRRQSIRR